MTRNTWSGSPLDPNAPDNVAQDAAQTALRETHHDRQTQSRFSAIPAIISVVALAFSGFSLWQTSLKPADLAVFVPPVVHFSQPYSGGNFEVIEVPVTIANAGAQAGTLVAMNLAVTDPRSGATKHFYSASLGRWTMDQARALALKPFVPMSVPGNASQSETILFYTRGDDQKPDELIREPGKYNFKLSIVTPGSDAGLLARMIPGRSRDVTFERELKTFDARAFTNGTLPLYAPDWSAATNAGTSDGG